MDELVEQPQRVEAPQRQVRQRGLRVLCVRWGDKYTEDYVYKLRDACERHLPAHEFVCITENPLEGVQCNPLVCDLPGWWQKVGLFAPGLFPGQNLYLDLDVVITDALAPLVAASRVDPLALWVEDDFSYSIRYPRDPASMAPGTRKLLGGPGTIQSSVMAWHGWPESKVYKVWEDFEPSVMDELHGDQNWITRALWPDAIEFFPAGLIKSYKYGNQKQAPVVVFHGEPKPHQVANDWVKEHWV